MKEEQGDDEDEDEDEEKDDEDIVQPARCVPDHTLWSVSSKLHQIWWSLFICALNTN